MSYELVIVSKTSESDGLLGRVEKALKDAQATEVKVEKLGKKQLAYPIKKQLEADYTMINFEVAGSAIAELSSLLRLEQEALLRHMLIKQKIRVKPRRKLRVRKAAEPEKVVEAPKVTVAVKKKVDEVSEVSEVSKKKSATVDKSDKISKTKKAPKTKAAARKK